MFGYGCVLQQLKKNASNLSKQELLIFEQEKCDCEAPWILIDCHVKTGIAWNIKHIPTSCIENQLLGVQTYIYNCVRILHCKRRLTLNEEPK